MYEINQFALIIGAMKCGTTSLFSYLSQHPQISPSTEKEPSFFSVYRHWENGFDWYQKLWDWNPNVHKVALEASTSYTRIPTYLNSASKIHETAKKYDKNFKFIYVVRDPIERIQSHYTYAKSLGHPETTGSPFTGIRSDLITTSMYAKQLSYYRTFFPIESILVVHVSELKREPHKLLKKICSFLEIDDGFEFQDVSQVVNKNAGRIKDDAIWRALKAIKVFDPIAKKLPSEYKKFIHSLYGEKIEKNYSLSDNLQNFIISMLLDDMRHFNEEYGIDLLSDASYEYTLNNT